MSDSETIQAVTWALEAGVRHVDTATCLFTNLSLRPPFPLTNSFLSLLPGYENEAACKKAIESFLVKHDLPRSSIFYTTKLRAPTTYENALKAIEYSVKNAPGGEIDLYLMHSAIGGEKLREASWKAMEEGKKNGHLRSIGVSFFLSFV